MMDRRRCKRGFTLIEIMIVVAIIGVLAALALFGMKRYLTGAKTAEAKQALGAMARGITMLSERTAPSQLVGPGGNSSTPTLAWCPECGAAATCIAPQAVPAATKYQPNNSGGNDFDACCWKCIRFSMDTATYFQYRYAVGQDYVGPPLGAPDPGGQGAEVAAIGDLDGDGTQSTLTISGARDAQTGTYRFATQVFVANEGE